MAKSLKDILAGQKKSKVSPPDIDDKNLYQWNGPDGVKFIKKHEVETHDYPHDAEAAFKGKKGGVEKTSKYKFQKDGVYEGVGCNHTMEGVMCEVHGESACPTKEDDVNTQKTSKKDSKGRSYLADKKKCMDEGRVLRDLTQKDHNKPTSSYQKKMDDEVRDKKHNYIKSSINRDLKRLDKKGLFGGIPDKNPVKEENLDEVAPPSPKIEKWINSNKERFVKEYGKEKGMQVLYAKAWKMHGQSESGTATNTDYTGPGAAGYTTGRLDVGTL